MLKSLTTTYTKSETLASIQSLHELFELASHLHQFSEIQLGYILPVSILLEGAEANTC